MDGICGLATAGCISTPVESLIQAPEHRPKFHAPLFTTEERGRCGFATADYIDHVTTNCLIRSPEHAPTLPAPLSAT